jgi:hybrid cluster-associated redox disulfide protein
MKRKNKRKSSRSIALRINKNMTFEDVLRINPKIAEILMKKGMHCIGCSMAMYETLEQGAIMHGINPDKLVDELNKKIKKT